VILAGGRGTRLRPITDRVPKPMIPFHGKPFLEYLIEMLRQQGFQRILLLLGYLPDAIRDYFGDGSRWGVEIGYSVSPEADETGRRIKLAASKIDPIFLLMYCDNYWPIRIDAMLHMFDQAEVPGLITVYENSDGYSRDNVRIDSNGLVSLYDKSRTAPGLSGVDIGFMIMKREVLGLLPDGNVSFEKEVLPPLVAANRLAAYVTGHRYYSVGTHERLPLTEEFLARHPAIILDRDGVLNRRPPKGEYVRSWREWEWLPGSLDALRLLKKNGFRVVIVSNQAGVERGVMSEDDVADIHRRMMAEVADAGGDIEKVYICPHHWDDGCACRKPKPGMLFNAQRDFSLDLSRTNFIGDDERDGQAAEAAGCPFLMASDAQSMLDHVRLIIGEHRAFEAVRSPSGEAKPAVEAGR